MRFSILLPIALFAAAPLGFSQRLLLRPAPQLEIPTLVDGNSPAFWRDGTLNFLTSTGQSPVILRGPDQFAFSQPESLSVYPAVHYPVWIESAWADDDGTIYGWYHHEQQGVCPGDVTAPQIGAVVSNDGGATFIDLGLVLTSGAPLDCNAGNGIFAGGNGDFSVILDRDRKYFYFLFTHYAGDLAEQGVAVARMSFKDRLSPSGAVFKHFKGAWNEPGLGGRLTPIFGARVGWQESGTDSFWGPAVHWNTQLETYVVFMNRSCCKPRWPQEGIYVSFNPDLSNPAGWYLPQGILAGKDIGYGASYYPQIIGLGPGETDTLAGAVARLYVHGKSRWEVVFQIGDPIDRGETQPDAPRDDSDVIMQKRTRHPKRSSSVSILSPHERSSR